VRPEAVGTQNVQVARGPDHTNHHREGIAGWPQRQCPIAHGCGPCPWAAGSGL